MLTIVIKVIVLNDHVLMTLEAKVHSFEQTLFISELDLLFKIYFCLAKIKSSLPTKLVPRLVKKYIDFMKHNIKMWRVLG